MILEDDFASSPTLVERRRRIAALYGGQQVESWRAAQMIGAKASALAREDEDRPRYDYYSALLRGLFRSQQPAILQASMAELQTSVLPDLLIRLESKAWPELREAEPEPQRPEPSRPPVHVMLRQLENALGAA